MSAESTDLFADKLQRLVVTRLRELGQDKPLSPREASRRAGGAVSYDTIYKIARGEHRGALSDKVAQGLAAALEVPVAQVYDAAGAPRPAGRWVLPERFDRLDPAQREIVESVAAAMLESYEKGRRAQ